MRGLILAFLLAAAAAWAGPKTGGSFGGGNFHSGSSGSSSGYRSGGGGSTFSTGGGGYHYSGSSYRSSGGGGMPMSAGTMGLLFCAIAVIVVVAWVRNAAQGVRPIVGPTYVGGPVARSEVHLSRLMLGIDWRERKRLQARLAELAQTSDTGTPAGLAAALQEIVVALQRAQIAWLYAASDEGRWLSMADAEGAFNQAVGAARGRFEVDVVRGKTIEQPPEVQAHAEQGAGTVVVTLIVACRTVMAGIANPHDARAIREAVTERGGVSGNNLVAFEVVWTPAVDGDRLSTADLERVFPELSKIDPSSIAGRVICEYCSGPYPAELLKCPHCGAAAPAAGGAA